MNDNSFPIIDQINILRILEISGYQNIENATL